MIYETYREAIFRVAQGHDLEAGDVKLLVNFFDITIPVCILTKFKFRRINVNLYFYALMSLHTLNGYTVDESYLIEFVSENNLPQTRFIHLILLYVINNPNYTDYFFHRIVVLWLENCEHLSSHYIRKMIDIIQTSDELLCDDVEIYTDIIEREHNKRILIGSNLDG